MPPSVAPSERTASTESADKPEVVSYQTSSLLYLPAESGEQVFKTQLEQLPEAHSGLRSRISSEDRTLTFLSSPLLSERPFHKSSTNGINTPTTDIWESSSTGGTTDTDPSDYTLPTHNVDLVASSQDQERFSHSVAPSLDDLDGSRKICEAQDKSVQHSCCDLVFNRTCDLK